MLREAVKFEKTERFSKLFCDYISESERLKKFMENPPTPEGLYKQLKIKSLHFTDQRRDLIYQCINHQYKQIKTTSSVKYNIESLKQKNTFTITTGHQLNLFTGPLYFFYKIMTTIRSCQEMKRQYPDYQFVPIYWMASEDHDFEEINHFNFKGKTFSWNRSSEGAVGEISTKGLDKVFNLFSQELGTGKNAEFLRMLFRKSYLDNSDLSLATRTLVNELFKEEGLVIIDANEKLLKDSFSQYLKADISEQLAYREILKTNTDLKKMGYKVQVNPREVNLFYFHQSKRLRIVKEGEGFSTADYSYTWSKTEILDEISAHSERFSPNVLIRPLYQEAILPNICYVGGAGELAYWLQLKSFFQASNLPFPVLMPRHSLVLVSDKQDSKIKNLKIDYSHLFLDKDRFINIQVRKISDIDIDFSSQKKHLKAQFESLYQLAKKTDKSFVNSVAAQEKKQIKGLNQLEKRLLKAQKKKLSDWTIRSVNLKNELFPLGNLQERSVNFSEFYLQYGQEFISKISKNIKAFDYHFLIV